MKHANMADLDLLSHKMNICFHVLGALVLNRVARQVNSINIITLYERSPLKWNMQLEQQVA